MIKVCIIDDHAIVRAGLRMLIENSPRMSVLWETQTASEALSNPDLEHPHVILLDLDLGIERGLDLLPEPSGKVQPGAHPRSDSARRYAAASRRCCRPEPVASC